MSLPPYIPALAILLLAGTALAAPDPEPPPTGADAGLLALDARARAGDAQAQLDLADAYGDVPFDRPTDVARASAWYRLATAAPDKDIRRRACAALGTLEAGGMGWPENVTAALPWYRCAADLGDAQSQFNLALLYDEGVDVPADTPQAVRWYHRAAEGGLVLALERLGALAERDHDRDGAVRLYGEAAAKGDIAAAQALARLQHGGPSPQVVGIGLAAQSQDPATVKPPPKPVPGQPRTPPATVGADGLRLIQWRLRDLGYLHGPADGRLGARTANAILAYEVAHPAVWDETAPPPDGWPSRELLAKLSRR
ncbi:SEL1-like repeat protein [Nitrospirillum sp. BR 11164]|uniref:SEL1-like repeat protein n=1 Tax=Nitrospirillum sp. BR 11164 TaxID=3104324 RepID=UPI002AFFEB02|nr:SEL1-like repeat protein [Nitrospirillum sp. BR 11164]MEA1650231.1 SEL1-like repeat protein [Nitrospirillum sp. BR 11164]